MTKVQSQTVRHMFLAHTYLKRRPDGNWSYSKGTNMIRNATVAALMQQGYITSGVENANLTTSGVKWAQTHEL